MSQVEKERKALEFEHMVKKTRENFYDKLRLTDFGAPGHLEARMRCVREEIGEVGVGIGGRNVVD